MLLGSTNTGQQYANEEAFIIQLLGQKRYAEAYVLLQREAPNEPSTQYNIALCHYWAANYQEALTSLDKAQSAMVNTSIKGESNIPNSQLYNLIRQQQNQLDDHLHAISKNYVVMFTSLTRDTIIRLKTDCWLQLGDFSNVIKTATPIAHKNYSNIINALKLAQNHTNDEH